MYLNILKKSGGSAVNFPMFLEGHPQFEIALFSSYSEPLWLVPKMRFQQGNK